MKHPRRPSIAALLYLRGWDADARLRGLEAQRVRVRPVLGALAARLSERRAWRPLGFRTLSDYARERLGVGARVVSEWARVWRALERLPVLRQAVLSGELSWTVARLVVGVATPETEAACLETVRGRTVRAVEALVAAVRAAERGEGARGAEGSGAAAVEADDEDCEERVAFRMACPRAVGGKWNAAIELARRMQGAQLPVWGCAELIAAEVASALPPEPDPDPTWSRDALGAGAAASVACAAASGADPAATEAGVAATEAGAAATEAGAAATEARAAAAEASAAAPGNAAGLPSPPGSAGGLSSLAPGPPGDRGIGPGAVAFRSAGAVRGPAGSCDPEAGLRATAFPHLSWGRLAGSRPVGTDAELLGLAEKLEDCGPHELDRRLRAAVAFLQSLDAELGRVLRQVVHRRLYAELGFPSFERYVRERLDTAPRTAWRLARLARAELRAPALANAFREGHVTAFQAEVLLGVIERGGPRTPRPLDTLLPDLDGLARLQDLEKWIEQDRENRRACAERRGVDGRRLSADAVEAQWLALARRTTLRRLELEANAEPATAVSFHAPPDVVAFFQSVLGRVHGRLLRSHTGDAKGIASANGNEREAAGSDRAGSASKSGVASDNGARNAGSSGHTRGSGTGAGERLPPWAALEAMLDHVIVTWLKEECAAVRGKPRDYADFTRDGYRCTMPGCTARAMLERHHVRFRSNGGPDIPENRTTLCWFHHHADVHQRLARISGRAPDRLLFELGIRPDGPPLARYRSGDVAL